jgi:YVTN family beta-propeller protein
MRAGAARLPAAVGLALVALLAASAPAQAATAHTAYVTAGVVGNDVTPIDTLTNTPGAAFGAGDFARELAITPDALTAYVTNDIHGTVTPVDTATNAAGTAIPAGSFPIGIAITPDGKTAYVADDGSPGNVKAIDTATNTVVATIPVGTGPTAVAITPDGQTAYVTISGSGSHAVTPINTATNTPGAPIVAGSNPFAIAITPDGKTAYVVNIGSSDVTPIDTATNTAGTPISVGANPEAIAITPDGKTAYVANTPGNTVTPINTATNMAGTPIPVGTSPVAIVITPDGRTAYVANQNSANVTPVDTSSNTTRAPITVSSQPLGIAITPDQAPTAAFTTGAAVVGQSESFDATGSSATPGQTVAGYRWDFGDGTTQTTSSATTSHTYAALGSYTATLTVTDDAGCSTAQVFTGQTMSCNGSQAARISHQVTVSKATPTLSTTASPAIVYGAGSVHDTATLSGGASPGGQITFNLYRAADTTCSALPVFTDTTTVSGSGDYDSADFFPPQPGTYRWIASYSGDADNEAVSGACGDPSESVAVKAPKITDLHLDPDHFAPALKPTPLGPPLPKAQGGSTIKLHLNASGFVHFFVRRKGAPPPNHHRQRHGFNRILAKGENSVRFTANLYGRALRPGKYRLYARPVALSGRRFKRVSAPFVIAARY